MAAGSNSQQNFRKAIGALKDTTMVGMAKVNSEYKGLDVAILKATNHVESLPKEKHVRTILGAISGSRPRADVSYCIQALARRLAKTRSWIVSLKTLIVIHRALREVDHSFSEELISYNNSRGDMLNLLHFKDESSPNAWDYSTWIRTYALYLEECLECFRVLKYDFYRDHSRTKKFDTPDLLEHLPAMQQLLFRLLACQPYGSARYNFIIQFALSIVATESVRLYVAVTDGVLVLVDKFFEMQRRDAVRALEIYRRSGEQADRLSEFFEVCRSLEFGRRQKYVKIEQPPPSFLTAMEEYVKDVPQTLMLQWRPNDDDANVPKSIGDAETDPKENSDTEDSKDQKTDKSDAELAPLIPDLLSWDEPSQESYVPNENNSVSFLLAAPEDSSNSAVSTEASGEPASWELALVTTTDAASVAQSKVNVLDRSTLDRLYELALAPKPEPTTTNYIGAVPSNPFEAEIYNQEMYYYPPNHMEPMNIMRMGKNEILNQQPGLEVVGPDYMQQVANSQQIYLQIEPQPQVDHDYMAIPQQQAEPSVPHQQSTNVSDYTQMVGTPQNDQQKQSSAGHGYGYSQQVEIPVEKQVSTQQQLEQQMVGQESANPFGNPFVDQGSLSHPPQTSNSSITTDLSITTDSSLI